MIAALLAPIQPYMLLIKLALLAMLIAALGVQTYRLKSAQGEIAVFEERELAQKRDQARREATNLRNKERTDENHAADLKRAATVVVRSKPAAIITSQPAFTRSIGQSAECLSRGDVDRVVDSFASQHAARLGSLIAEVSQRHAAGATHVAREGETLAAGFRACKAFAVDLE
jgi:hypothetical protein